MGVRVVGFCLALAACVPITSNAPQGEWRLAELAGAPADAPRPTITIRDLHIGGFAGCNTFSGRIEDDPNVAAFLRGGVAVTEMYCEAPSAMQMEGLFLNALNGTARISVEGETLVFYDVDDKPTMRFEPASEAVR